MKLVLRRGKLNENSHWHRNIKENNTKKGIQRNNPSLWIIAKKVIFSDESRINIGHGNDVETFVWCHLVKTFRHILYKKSLSTKEDLLTAIRERWNHLVKEY